MAQRADEEMNIPDMRICQENTHAHYAPYFTGRPMRMREPEMITTREFADAIGRHYLTVLRWLREGLVPGAVVVRETSGTVYRVPKSAISQFKGKSPRPRGRPRKPKADPKPEV